MSSPNNPSRLIGGVAAFFAVYAAAYWLYEPNEPPITFGEPPSLATLAAAGVDLRGSAPDDAPSDSPSDSLAPAADARPAGFPSQDPGVPQTAASEPESKLVRTVIPPTFREYVVRRGDGGWADVSRRAYGTARHAEAIARANPLVSPEKLIPGRTRLRIPVDPSNVSGKPATVKVEIPPAPAAAPPPAHAQTVPPHPPAPASTTEYVVRDGDTLSDIARRELGASSLWPRIVELNPTTLRDPKRLRPGTRLLLPAR